MKLPAPPSSSTEPKKPRSFWDTIITSTPVVMTVLATILAGLSSSEMTRAMYYRSVASQNQSKAGDQWNFFQAKKLRGAYAIGNLDVMRIQGDISPLTPDAFNATAEHLIHAIDASPAAKIAAEPARALAEKVTKTLADPEVKTALETMASPLPPVEDAVLTDSQVVNAYKTLKKGEGDDAPLSLFGQIKDPALRDAFHAVDLHIRESDASLTPTIAGIGKLQKLTDTIIAASRLIPHAAMDAAITTEIRQLNSDFTAARVTFDAARHDREAKLNQQNAYLFEVAVRKTSWQSDRSMTRSHYFFYGMLGAQAAVMIASFALAVRERSWMWSIAASIGVIAMSYAGYVYLFT